MNYLIVFSNIRFYLRIRDKRKNWECSSAQRDQPYSRCVCLELMMVYGMGYLKVISSLRNRFDLILIFCLEYFLDTFGLQIRHEQAYLGTIYNKMNLILSLTITGKSIQRTSLIIKLSWPPK